MPGPDARAPVLAYHRISRRPLLAGTWVAPARLGAQLDALQGAGLRPLDADAWLAAAAGFLVTFDDGTEDLLRHRALLESRGVPAVVFVPGDLLGRQNRWEWPLPTRRTRHLDAAALRSLAGAGWEIGLHGGRHRDLLRCDDGWRTGSAGRCGCWPIPTGGPTAGWPARPLPRTSPRRSWWRRPRRTCRAGWRSCGVRSTASTRPAPCSAR
jgi:hypothetical protein